jgi:hypothetical protein
VAYISQISSSTLIHKALAIFRQVYTLGSLIAQISIFVITVYLTSEISDKDFCVNHFSSLILFKFVANV